MTIQRKQHAHLSTVPKQAKHSQLRARTKLSKDWKKRCLDRIQKIMLYPYHRLGLVQRNELQRDGNPQRFADLLFYQLTLHQFVAVIVRKSAITDDELGQLAQCMKATDDMDTQKNDLSIGLVAWSEKDKFRVFYAFPDDQLSTAKYDAKRTISGLNLVAALPQDLWGSFPDPQAIAAELLDAIKTVSQNE